MIEITKYLVAGFAMIASTQPMQPVPDVTPMPRVQSAAKPSTPCPPKWPYIVKVCVA